MNDNRTRLDTFHKIDALEIVTRHATELRRNARILGRLQRRANVTGNYDRYDTASFDADARESEIGAQAVALLRDMIGYFPSEREMRADVLDTLREWWDDADPFGSALGAQFACADALVALGESVPDVWEYRPAAGLNRHTVMTGNDQAGDYDQASTLVTMIDRDQATADTLRYLGNVLRRYVALCAALGKSY